MLTEAQTVTLAGQVSDRVTRIDAAKDTRNSSFCPIGKPSGAEQNVLHGVEHLLLAKDGC